MIDEQIKQISRYVEDFIVIWFNKLANQFGLQGRFRGNKGVFILGSYQVKRRADTSELPESQCSRPTDREARQRLEVEGQGRQPSQG